MERTVFNSLFKDVMTHIHDFAALETHPLALVIDIPEHYSGSRGHYIQHLVLDEIECFQPAGKECSIDAVEWRPYLILRKRYVDGIGLQELSDYLAISKRQMRRDHSRALQALAGRLWDQVFQKKLESHAKDAPDGNGEGAQAFEVNPEILDLSDVLQGVIRILQRYLDAEGIDLHLELRKIAVLTDRVILRQILISLFNYAVHIQYDNQQYESLGLGAVEGISPREIPKSQLYVRTSLQDDQAAVEFKIAVDAQWYSCDDDEHDDLLGSIRFWSERLDATLRDIYPPRGESGVVRLVFALPVANQPSVLVVDDQQPTLRMYQRYLSRSNFKVVGVNDPNQVLSLVKQLQPDLILLDVMMPQVDGWEILQALQLDENFRAVPVIVCSAWESSDLARSLGAADFLKKPITQEELLTAIQQLNLQK